MDYLKAAVLIIASVLIFVLGVVTTGRDISTNHVIGDCIRATDQIEECVTAIR